MGFDYNIDRIDALAGERAAEWRRIDAASFLTVDEKREAAGYGAAPKVAAAGKGLGEALERCYSPNQPRDDIGRWTSGGGGGAAPQDQTALDVDPNVASDASSPIIPAQAGYPVDLTEEEANGGHTIERHVAKSEEYLIRRSESSRFQIGGYGFWKDRVGSFPSLQAAGKLINSTLEQNQSIVDKVASGELYDQDIEAWFNSPTGYESYAPTYRAQPEIRDTWGVRVHLRYDSRSSRRFRIISGFPINR